MSELCRRRSGRLCVRVDDGRGGGTTVVPYEWEQSLDEVDVFVPKPSADRLTRRSVPRFVVRQNTLTAHVVMAPGVCALIEAPLAGRADGSSSFWCTDSDGDVLHIVIAKAVRGEPWPALFAAPAGAEEDAAAVEGSATSSAVEAGAEQARKEMLLQRFQEEHPGFDFSGAEVTGSAPEDPMHFMDSA